MSNSNKIAILVEQLYEDQELWYPYYRLKEAGYNVKIVGPEKKTYYSKHQHPVLADLSIDETGAEDFIGVVIPGGYAPDHMRRYPKRLSLYGRLFRKVGLVRANGMVGGV